MECIECFTAYENVIDCNFDDHFSITVKKGTVTGDTFAVGEHTLVFGDWTRWRARREITKFINTIKDLYITPWVDSSATVYKKTCMCEFLEHTHCTACGAKAPECTKCAKKSMFRRWQHCPDCGTKYIYN